MKSAIVTLVAFFALLFIYTKAFGPIPFTVNSVTTQKTDTFQVTGEGKAIAVPDLAVISVGVSSTGATVKAAQENLNNNINKVSSSIKALGIKESDIQTTNYSINPNYDFTAGSQKISGFSANSNLTVKVREVDKANSVIDAATSSGANQIGGISFENADKTKAEDEARKKAVEAAKKKAVEAAKTAGFKLGNIINYSENFTGTPMPIRAMATLDSKTPTPPTQVEPGSNEVVITVTLSYQVL